MVDQEDIVLTAEHGSHLPLPVRCPECQTTGEVPTAWVGLNIRCRKCGIHFRANAANMHVSPLRAHDFKPEVADGATPRRVLLGQLHTKRTTRGTAA